MAEERKQLLKDKIIEQLIEIIESVDSLEELEECAMEINNIKERSHDK